MRAVLLMRTPRLMRTRQALTASADPVTPSNRQLPQLALPDRRANCSGALLISFGATTLREWRNCWLFRCERQGQWLACWRRACAASIREMRQERWRQRRCARIGVGEDAVYGWASTLCWSVRHLVIIGASNYQKKHTKNHGPNPHHTCSCSAYLPLLRLQVARQTKA